MYDFPDEHVWLKMHWLIDSSNIVPFGHLTQAKSVKLKCSPDLQG